MTGRSREMAKRLFVVVAAIAALLAPAQASAQTCGTDYVLKPGDTLADIARAVYGSASQWSIIYYANQDRLGDNTTLLVPGLAIKVPCIGQQQTKPSAPPPVEAALTPGAPTEQAPFQLSSMLRRIDFLTADGYAPFTGRNLPEGGLLIDLLQSSMNLIKDQAKGRFDFQISWVNDWAAHLNPLLITRALDAGIPWTKPDCSGDQAALDRASLYRCQKFFFSDPFYESVTELFVRNDSDFDFKKDEQIAGKTLCVTKGWSTYDLDKGGRNWVKNGTITLMQPPTIEECFRLLDEATVDAVVVAELTGQSVAAAMGMADRIHAASRPLNIETMHVIIAKTHPHARTVLYYVNSSLARLKETGAYDAIIAKHLEQFWNSLGQTASVAGPPKPVSAGSKPAPPTPPKPESPKLNADGKKTARP
jgi:polar amino acid transport system substrate-binding protein